MQYWLLKSEPNVWSIDQQFKAGSKGVDWDGVRNHQAANNLKKMNKGDLCFFYHSVSERSVVGIVRVVREFYDDPTDKTNKFVVVDVEAVEKLRHPVTLDRIKQNENLLGIDLIKQTRLSVMAIKHKEWKEIIKMSNKNG